MNLESALRGAQSIYFDSAPMIYWVEAYPAYIAKMDYIIGHIEVEQIRAYTSLITVTEVMVLPLRVRDTVLLREYYKVLEMHEQLTVLPITPQVAIAAAALRASYRLRTPDALHAASAILSGCDAFLTNDADFRRVQELDVLVLKDLTV